MLTVTLPVHTPEAKISAAGETTSVRFVQRGRTQEAPITIAADPTLEIVRYEKAGLTPTPEQLAFREAWLGPDAPANEGKTK